MEIKMEGIREFIDKLVTTELQKASNYATRRTVNLRVVQAIAKELDVPLQPCIDSKCLYLHPDNSQRIDEQWSQIVKDGIPISHEESNAYEKVKSADYQKIPDLLKFVNVLVRKNTVFRDGKERVLKSDALPELVAMDGFDGYANEDVKNYIENLKVGDEVDHEQDRHIVAVRKMYVLLPRSLNGTDAASVVFLSLLHLYRPHVDDQNALNFLDSVVKSVSDHLSQNITTVDPKSVIDPEFLERLGTRYAEKLVQVEKIALRKVAFLVQKEKKAKRSATYEKRGRKRLNNGIRTEEEGDEMKRIKVEDSSEEEQQLSAA